MKKHGLLKTLGIMILLLIVLSYIIPGRQDTLLYTGLADIFINYFGIVFQNFCYIVLYVLVIGGFYGVLNKIPAYKKLLDSIVTKVKPLGKKFIFFTIILSAVIASMTGMSLELIIFVPLVASIILLLGYDKLVALSATIVSIMIGYIGGIFVAIMNANINMISTYETFVGVNKQFANTFPKLLLLVSGIALLIYFVNKHIVNVENKKVKYDLDDSRELLINEVKKDYKKIKTWPLIVILSFLFIVLVLGMMPWNELFKVSVFTKLHEWAMGLSIKKFALIPSIISANLPALGAWNANGHPWFHYIYISMFLLFIGLIITIVYRVKIDDLIDNFIEGLKKTLPTALLISVAYLVLVCTYNNGFLEHIITKYGKFNYGISSLIALLGCIFNVDSYYITTGIFAPIVNLITDESINASVALLFQGIYGITSLIGPTSLILIFGLSYIDVPYTTWLKYIWRFILSLIILLALVVLLVVIL